MTTKPLCQESMPLYFTYGSNMDRNAMALRCPASRALGPARLQRHRFVLMREGYASIVRDPDRVVHGLLWDLALRDVAPLDRYENVAEGLYEKAYQIVVSQHGARRALIYCGANAGPGLAQPGYMEAIVTAAHGLGLPEAYLAELAAHVPRRRAAPARSDATTADATIGWRGGRSS